MSQAKNAVPTNGHPSRTAAIIALYEEKVQQKLIAERLGISRNSVSQAIHDYRVKTGRYIDPEIIAPVRPRSPSLPEAQEVCSRNYRLLNHQKSVRGAREALRAMGAL